MNPNLKPIYDSFNEDHPDIQIKPDLFQIGAIAYLKENNETMDLLVTNKEAREEFKQFIKHIFSTKNISIQNLLREYQ